MKVQQRKIFIYCFLLSFSPMGFSYEVLTHATLSEAALKRSVLYDLENDHFNSEFLDELGLYGGSEGIQFLNSKNVLSSIIKLLQDGSEFEDNFPRPQNHFFDPLNDSGLLGVFKSSPDFILEDDPSSVGVSVPQQYSYRDAMDYFYSALTLPSREERDQHWPNSYETLARVSA